MQLYLKCSASVECLILPGFQEVTKLEIILRFRLRFFAPSEGICLPILRAYLCFAEEVRSINT